MALPEMRPALPANFQFSQSNLTDFDVCRRLFYLRWIERLEWPARPAGAEDGLTLGQRFHRLMRQRFIGIDSAIALAGEPADSPLRVWLAALEQYPPPMPTGACYPELALSAPWEAYRLFAKFDLLAVAVGQRAVIVDWKTGRRQTDAHYRQSWQSCLYHYLLAEAGAPYWDGAPPPVGQIEMLYWFADYPASPARFPYSAAEHAANRARLGAAISLIAGLPTEAFVPCDDATACARCIYQEFCVRGAGVGLATDEMDRDDDISDWIDAPEYEYA